MIASGAPADSLADALLALQLCAIDPGLGGVVARGGMVGDELVIALGAAIGTGAPIRRLPAHIDDERLFGGLDLGATLGAGRVVAREGLLAQADGGAIIVPMAERLSDGVAAAIAAALDTGAVVAEREGTRLEAAARFVVLALDEGVEDERTPAALADRLAFWIDLSGARPSAPMVPVAVHDVMRSPLPAAGDDALDALVSIAFALGIESIRAPILALRAARASARLAGRGDVGEADLALAARLVLGPRATRLPHRPKATRRHHPKRTAIRRRPTMTARKTARSIGPRSTISCSRPRSHRCRPMCSSGSRQGRRPAVHCRWARVRGSDRRAGEGRSACGPGCRAAGCG